MDFRPSTPENSFYGLRIVDISTPTSKSSYAQTSISQSPRSFPKRTSSRLSHRSRLALLRRTIWIVMVLLLVGILSGFSSKIWRTNKKELLTGPVTKGLQFINAGHPYIKFVGRWTSVENNTRKDGSFPGVYLDLKIFGSSKVLLSLRNSYDTQPLDTSTSETTDTDDQEADVFQLPNLTSAQPVSLLVRIDDEEYIVFPNATKIIEISGGGLNPSIPHSIRIIAPMGQHRLVETLQVSGIYLDKGGQLVQPSELRPIEEGKRSEPSTNRNDRTLEIVTDIPGSLARYGSKSEDPIHDILGRVTGWEYMLGEMFGAHHASIAMDGMCLVRNCIGGRDTPDGIGDVFFRSGPVGSEHYKQPWHFSSVPDVMVMNLGNADWESFQTYSQEYNKSIWDLSVGFENTYVSLIKSIRTLAYPKYSEVTVGHSPSIDSIPQAAAEVPIFVMRPLRGQLEGPTHAVVNRLRKEGDKAIFWIDTSGWLNTEVDFGGGANDQDFFLDEENATKQWRLTERGNQRLAILLHLHVCRYLARDVEKCAFLPPEVYQGQASDPEVARFDEYLEDERERKLKRLFWD